jgi:hypothetical protein
MSPPPRCDNSPAQHTAACSATLHIVFTHNGFFSASGLLNDSTHHDGCKPSLVHTRMCSDSDLAPATLLVRNQIRPRTPVDPIRKPARASGPLTNLGPPSGALPLSLSLSVSLSLCRSLRGCLSLRGSESAQHVAGTTVSSSLVYCQMHLNVGSQTSIGLVTSR